jgi:hypothetical protein
MYLSAEILTWPYDAEGRAYPSETDHVHRGHEIWRHAKNRLALSPTQLDRVDCISSLKRAINHRLKAIHSTYAFDQLPTDRPKKETFEKLQDYGLVRPAILKELLDVRNLIEHNDAPPPDLAKCKFYVDMVWYFLKSTDQLVEEMVDSLIYEHQGTNSHITLAIEPLKNWEAKASGLVHIAFLSTESTPGAIELTEYTATRSQDRSGLTQFRAVIQLEGTLLMRIAREYFSAAGYWYEDHAA